MPLAQSHYCALPGPEEKAETRSGKKKKGVYLDLLFVLQKEML